MKTIVLGGGSAKNKIWVDEVCKELNGEPVYYEDWLNGQDARINFEVEIGKVLQVINNEPFNMIIKSVGSLVGLGTIVKVPNLIQKLIICGVPLHDFSTEEINDKYKILASMGNILCFQNENDPHGSFIEVRDLISKINPNIKVICKTGEFSASHNYPYYQDFRDFLL